MAKITNTIDNFKMTINNDFVKKAEILKPKLYKEKIYPQKIVSLLPENMDWKVKELEDAREVRNKKLKKGDKICVDFKDHLVGYITLKLESAGSPPDAPAHLRIKLGEVPCEIGEKTSEYKGVLSSSWIQEEYIHIDVLPTELKLSRRYAFRYLEIEVLDTSPKYQLVIEDIYCETVTAADKNVVKEYRSEIEILNKIDKVALKTMKNCMQEVFEDGPKRDRRLWIGDLRLQALTNYFTFKNNDLVKRCLYLFGGLTQNEGRVGACLFLKPNLLVDDTALFDYSLFFISCLYDYYFETKDMTTLKDLWKVAVKQIEISKSRLDENGVVRDSEDWWCFLDWNDCLNKQGGAQGVFIYTLRQALELARILKDNVAIEKIEELLLKLIDASRKYLWDDEAEYFISGKSKQISWATQVWMILAKVFEQEKNKEILEKLFREGNEIKMVTPYMHHHLVEAMLENNMKAKAIEYMIEYWGGMLQDGADCFWELYDKENKYISPYGSRIINSYCHAWSCTPSYFIRKYKL